MVNPKETITKEPKGSKKKHEEHKYVEGECENCGNYEELYDVDGTMLCESCRDEEGQNTEEDSEED